MGDEEKKRRRFDPSMLGGPGKFNQQTAGLVGQVLGGLSGGIGAGLAAKMNERTLLVAAALQGLLAKTDPALLDGYAEVEQHDHAWRFAKASVALADAALARLAEVPDPRGAPSVEKVEP